MESNQIVASVPYPGDGLSAMAMVHYNHGGRFAIEVMTPSHPNRVPASNRVNSRMDVEIIGPDHFKYVEHISSMNIGTGTPGTDVLWTGKQVALPGAGDYFFKVTGRGRPEFLTNQGAMVQLQWNEPFREEYTLPLIEILSYLILAGVLASMVILIRTS
jgi:hypothetical protein